MQKYPTPRKGGRNIDGRNHEQNVNKKTGVDCVLFSNHNMALLLDIYDKTQLQENENQNLNGMVQNNRIISKKKDYALQKYTTKSDRSEITIKITQIVRS